MALDAFLSLNEKYFVSDIAVFVLQRDVKLQPTNQPTNRMRSI